MTNSSDSFRNVTRYTGQDYRFAPTYLRPRDPHSPTAASNDIKPKEQQGYYPISSFWTNTSNNNVWVLAGITNNLAKWILISSGSSGPMLMVAVPFGTSPVTPDGTGLMTYTSTAGSIVITGSPNTINFDLAGGGIAIDQINVDAHTAPGTDPVLPDGAGQITVTGAQVASGVVGTNVIRTDSLAANTYTIEIQRSTAVAATDITKNGVSHFDSAQFGVDANGFVTLAGSVGPAATKFDVDAHTAPGTDPVVPDASGVVIVHGGTTFATGTQANPIRTNSLAVNQYDIEVQLAGSNPAVSTANNFGVAQFDSNQFTVTSGYVQLTGASAAIEKVNLQTGTTPIVPLAGAITFNGATVAAGTNPVRTDGTGANTMALEVQISQAIAAADATKIGLSNFDSSSFAVAATGFVTLSTTGAGKTITGDTGGALSPVANNWNIFGGTVAAGTNPLKTAGAGNTLTINAQISQAIAATDATKIGLSNFNSARFTVDANGFVSTNGTGIVKWNVISASQTLAINNGYICVSPGGALSLALPAASTLGDIIEVTLDGATSWTITQAAGQQIRYNNLQTTSGATGTLASTDSGNTIRMVCQTANLKWNILSALGTLTVT